jgi:hypothetical protein
MGVNSSQAALAAQHHRDEEMEQRLADMRMMVDLVKTVAGRE